MPVWRGFVGERARTAVYGWSERAFELPYMRRNVLGYTVHIPLDPDLVQHVLLDNAANYEKPKLVKRLLLVPRYRWNRCRAPISAKSG